MNKSDDIKDLAAALAKAQGEIENASKSSINPHFKSKYADLAEVLNTVRPVFAANGLSVTQMPSFADCVCSVETLLMHSSGQWISSVASATVSKNDAQGVGSCITYLRRYSLAAVAGIAQEDDDANASVGHKPKADPLSDAAIRATKSAIKKAADMASLTELYNKTAPAIREAVKTDFSDRRHEIESAEKGDAA